jgi:hypothetical protein
VCPAFCDVGTLGAPADGMDVALFEEMGDLEIVLMRGYFDFEPGWLFFRL